MPIVIRPPEQRNQLDEAADAIQAQAWTQPDVVARDRQLAERLGVDPTPAEALRPLYEGADKAASARKALDGAPATQRMFADPQFAAVSHDSVDALSWWEKGFKGVIGDIWRKQDPRRLLGTTAMGLVSPAYALTQASSGEALRGVQQFGEGADDIRRVKQIAPVLYGSADEATKRKVWSDAVAARVNRVDPGWSPVGNAGRVVPQLLYGLERGKEAIAVGGVAGAGVGAVAGGVGAVPGAVIGAGAGATAGLSVSSFETNAALAYEDLILMRDEKGEVLDPEVARIAALAVGALSAPLDVVGIGFIGKALGLDALKRVGVRSVLQRATVREALLKLSKQWSGAMTAEGATEAGQQALQIMVEEITKELSGQEIEGRTAGEAAGEIAQAGAIGAVVGSTFGGAGVAVRAPLAVGEAEKARVAQEVFQAIADNAADAPLRGRDAQRYSEAIKAALRDGPVEAVYVDAAAFRDFFQQNKEDAYVAAESVGVSRASLDAALREGGDIAIPVGEYAAKLAGTPADQGLRRYFKLRADDKSLAEIEEIEANYPALQEELSAQAAEREAQVEAEDAATANVRELLVNRLRDAGSYDEPTIAAVVEPMVAAYRTMAARRGVSVEELARNIPPPQIAGRMSRVIRPSVAPEAVSAAIRDGAAQTGVSDRYMTALASRESAFDPQARASTSSAAGLFQFTEGTWMRVVGKNAAALGLNTEGMSREDILALRFDPQVSARAAGILTRDNAAALARGLGRAPDDGELYIAHFLGSTGALRLLNADLSANAAELLPRAAAANRSIFYDDDKPRSVAAVVERLKRGFDGDGVRVDVTPPATGRDGARAGIFQPREAADDAPLEQADIGPVIEARQIMEAYRAQAGVEREPLRVKAAPRPEVMKQIADAFDAAEHKPNDPETRAAYEALVGETLAQFRFLGDLRVEAWTEGGEPYANSAEMMADVRDNGHLWFFPTTEGFGEGADATGNVLLEPSGEFLADGRPLLNNDVFRIVHDFFGHVPSSLNFGPVGDLNAFLEHASMYSDAALPALAAETLMQNAWVNFGPQLRRADGSLPSRRDPDYVPIPQRRFADQKMFAAPREVIDAAFGLRTESEGSQDAQGQDARTYDQRPAGGVGDSRPASFAGAGPALDRPPVEADGTIRLWHWGKRGRLKSLDPERWGDNWDILPPEEKERIGEALGRTYFGLAVGRAGGYIPEGGLGPHRYEAAIPAERLYDFRADPDGLVEKARERVAAEELEPGDPGYSDYLTSFYEAAIKDAGHAGYWVNDPALGLVAAVYEAIPVRYVENERTGKTFFQSATDYDPGLGFRSAVHEVVVKGAKKASGDQWLATIRNAQGVKKEEIEWLGLEEFLTGRDGVTREELAAYIAHNGVHLAETELRTPGEEAVNRRAEELLEAAAAERVEDIDLLPYLVEWDAEEEAWAVMDGTGYTIDHYDSEEEAQAEADELFARDERDAIVNERNALPWDRYEREAREELEGNSGPLWRDYKMEGGENYRELLIELPPEFNPKTGVFRGHHWDRSSAVGNAMAHARLTDRVDIDGKRVLFIEELQSDWHQQGRDRGYRKEPDPAALAAATEDAERAEAAFEEAVERYTGRVLQMINDRLDALPTRKDNEAALQRTWDDLMEQKKIAEGAGFSGSLRQYGPYAEVAARYEELGAKETLRTYLREMSDWLRPSLDPHLRASRATEFVGVQRQNLGIDVTTKEGAETLAALVELRDDARAAALRLEEAANRLRAERGDSGLPDAPFKDTWPALVMKRLIRYAVEGGYDRVGITRGDIIGPIVGADDKTGWFYDRNLINITNGLIKRYGAKVEPLTVDGEEVNGFEVTDKMREAVISSGLTLFQDDRSTAGQPRGSITLPRAGLGAGREAVIALGDAADASTFLHESGHFFLEMLAAMASEPDAPQQMRDDLQAVLQWMGVNSPEEIGRDQHEQWAEGFEQYLFEGRSPTPRMRTVFEAFRSWLAFIYRQLRSIRSDLTDDVRGVMDRILATDEEIAQARETQGMAPLFASQEEAGVDDAAWESYQNLHRQALAAANEEANVRALRAAKREAERWYRDRKAEVREEVEGAVRERPIYRAFEWLAHGVWWGGEPPDGLPGMKLSREAIVQDYGEERLKSLPRGFRQLYDDSDIAVHPDVAAPFFGYSSGDELLSALAGMEKRAAVVERETNDLMVERYGDPVAQGLLADVAMDAVHNVDQGKLIERELSMMTGRKATQGAAEAARRDIGNRKVADLLRIDRHLQAERKAANAAQEAWRKGDRDEAVRQKYRQLVAYHSWRAAREANEEIGRARRYFDKFNSGNVRKKISKPFRDQIDALLEQYDFIPTTRRDVEERITLRELRDALIAEDREAELNFDEELMDRVSRQHFTELTMDQLRGLRDTVKNLDTLGRRENQLLTDDRANAYHIAVQELLHAAVTSGAKPLKQAPLDPDWLDKAGSRMRSVHASHMRMEFLFRRLDGLKDNGPWWRYLFRPLAEASNVKAEMMERAVERLQGIFANLDRADLFRKRVHIPEIGESLLGKSLFAVALNWGNEDNRAALVEGFGWDERQEAAVIGRIPEAYWRAAQEVWDLLETLREPAFDLEEDITGVRPLAVAPAVVETAFGVFRGGYYPLSYDRDRSAKVDQERRKDDITEAFGASGTRPVTRKGHLIARKGSGGRPVRLDLGVLTDHIEAVIHDVAYRRAVIDIDRLTQNETVREAIMRFMGIETYRLLRPWLVDVAKPRVDPRSQLEKTFMRLRLGSSIVNMGWKFTTAIVQPLGITNAMTRLGPRVLAAQVTAGPKFVAARLHQSVMRWFGQAPNMPEQVQFVMQRSPLMRERLRNFDRDANDLMRRQMDGWGGDIRRSFFYLTGLLDLGVSGPTWVTAYELAREGKVDGVEPDNEAQIIAYADSVVRMVVGSGEIKDLPDIMRGPELRKLFTGFYSYFSVLYNQLYVEQVPGVSNGSISKAQFVANLALLWIVPSVLSDLITGRTDDEDDGLDAEDVKAQALRTAMYPLSTVVLLRDMVAVLGTQFDFQITPISSAFDALVKAAEGVAKDVGEAASEGDYIPSKATMKNAFMAAGYWFGLPARQVWNTAEYVYDWLAGEVDEFNPFHALVKRPSEE